MRYFSLFFTFFLILLINSCGLWDKSKEENIIGKYYIGWVENPTDRCIFIKESVNDNTQQILVGGNVISAGNNHRFIWAKSLPNPNSTEVIRYHIIDISKDKVSTYNIEKDFIASLKELGIDDVEFSRNYYFAP